MVILLARKGRGARETREDRKKGANFGEIDDGKIDTKMVTFEERTARLNITQLEMQNAVLPIPKWCETVNPFRA